MITIDSEFKSLIPPLTPEEYAGLEASIIKEGCRDALIIWDGTLIDGHNRYEMCIKHEIEYDTSELVFNSRDDAIDWIYQNQLSRRNLTDNNIRYLRGKQYEHRKKMHGGDHGNQYTKVAKAQNGPLANTAQNVAEEHNVSKNTIKRDAEYARAVDTIARDYGEEEKQKILVREVKTSQKEVKEVATKLNAGMMSSETPEWYTPSRIINAVNSVFEIDLDPCSNDKINPNIPAKNHFTKEDDGLKRGWTGCVYMNPPYGKEIGVWINKVIDEYLKGACEEAIVLVPARTDTAWFNRLNDYPWCAVRGRLKFSQSENSAPFPSAVFYLGKNVNLFYAAFCEIGTLYLKIPPEDADVW